MMPQSSSFPCLLYHSLLLAASPSLILFLFLYIFIETLRRRHLQVGVMTAFQPCIIKKKGKFIAIYLLHFMEGILKLYPKLYQVFFSFFSQKYPGYLIHLFYLIRVTHQIALSTFLCHCIILL